MRSRELGLMAAAALIAATGCDDDVTATATASSSGGSSSAGGGDVGGEGSIGGEGSWIVETGSGGCDTVIYDPPDQKSKHVEECSPLEHLSNPPTSGPHYPKWADFKSYAEPVPRGYYLHSMEHGAVVLMFACELSGGAGGSGGAAGAGGSTGAGGSSCDALAASLETFADTLPVDEKCEDKPVDRRVLILSDPKLDVPFAVGAWGHMLKAQCFDEEIVAAFIEEHYAMASEDTCGSGFDPTDPAERVPADCGD